jgi:hypothetical protein
MIVATASRQYDQIKEGRMAALRNVNHTHVNKAKNGSQAAYAKAWDVSQSTYAGAKDVAQTAYSKAKDVSQSAYVSAKDVAQSTYSSAKDVAQDKFEDVRMNALKLLTTLSAALTVAQKLLDYNQKKAGKQLKKTRKNLLSAQDTMQDLVETNWKKTQKALDKGSKKASKALDVGSKKASKGLKQVQSSAKDVTASVKDISGSVIEQYERYQRKRKRARAIFRWGLIIGVIVAFLYTPLPGSEVRRRVSGAMKNVTSLARNVIEQR